MTAYVPALPYDDPRHLAAHHFLVEEAAILDAGDWARWLGLLTDDVRYVMPVRVTMVHDAASIAAPGWPTSTRTATPSRSACSGC